MNSLRFINEQVVWQEVPNETSLAYLFSGCPLRCKGCHSSDAWKAKLGTTITPDYLEMRLKQYSSLISCVLFMGGEWHVDALERLLKIARSYGLKTCLYTGLEHLATPEKLLPHLTYLKTGRWIPECGGLDNPNTNQSFIDLRSGKSLNHYFFKSNGVNYDSPSA